MSPSSAGSLTRWQTWRRSLNASPLDLWECKFPNVAVHHRCVRGVGDASEVQRILKDALRKIPFPYNGMTGPDVWEKGPVLEREHYFDDFAKKHISDEDYESVKALAAKLGMRTFRDYHDQYFEMDYLSLCDILDVSRQVPCQSRRGSCPLPRHSWCGS